MRASGVKISFEHSLAHDCDDVRRSKEGVKATGVGSEGHHSMIGGMCRPLARRRMERTAETGQRKP